MIPKLSTRWRIPIALPSLLKSYAIALWKGLVLAANHLLQTIRGTDCWMNIYFECPLLTEMESSHSSNMRCFWQYGIIDPQKLRSKKEGDWLAYLLRGFVKKRNLCEKQLTKTRYSFHGKRWIREYLHAVLVWQRKLATRDKGYRSRRLVDQFQVER